MREEEASVNGLARSQHEGNTAESGGRRNSVVTLQNMLKKVSQSSFHNQYDADRSDVMDKQTDLRQSLQEQLHLSPRNGLSQNLVNSNPFYSYYLESTGRGPVLEDAGRDEVDEVNPAAFFVSPSEFQSCAVAPEPETRTVENGGVFAEPDIFQTHEQEEDLLLASILGQKNSLNGDFHDLTFKTPNYFNTNSARTQNASNAEVFPDKDDLFQSLKGGDLLQSQHSDINASNKSSSYFVDPFKSHSDEDDLFRSSQTVAANPFYTTPTSESDLFLTSLTKGEELLQESRRAVVDKDLVGVSSLENLLSSSSTNAGNLFQSPLPTNLFQDFSSLEDPFSPTPSKSDTFLRDVSDGTPGIFQQRPSDHRESMDLFGNAPSKITFSTPSISPSEMKLDFPASPDLLNKKTLKFPPVVPPKPFHRPNGITPTTPQGSKHDILQPTPFSQASSASPLLTQSPADTDHIFRRPPRPLPRTRPPRPLKPVIPVEKEPGVQKDVPKTPPKLSFRSLQKPVIRRKPKTPEPKPVEPENFVVFEDILLIGEELCVDDWPEDAPENDPDFKPAGKFRLRRESLKIKTDSEGGSGDDHSGTLSKKKKKFAVSLRSRKSLKERFSEDTLEGKSSTLPILHKSSKENLIDVNTSAGEINDEDGLEYRKKPLKTKVNSLFRRASTASSLTEGSHMNGHLPQESKKGDLNKSNGKSKTIERRWSEGDMLDGGTGEEAEGGEAHREKTRKKLKIKFVPQRGFAITLEKPNEEPKGANGYTPRKASKDKSSDEVLGAHGYTPRDGSKIDDFEDVEEIKSQLKAQHYSLKQDEDDYGFQDCKPKKATKMKVQHAGRRSSKENMLESSTMQKKKSSFSAEELEDEELNWMKKNHAPVPVPRNLKTSTRQAKPSASSHHTHGEGSEEEENPAKWNNDEDDLETCKPKKPLKLKGHKKHKNKSKAAYLEGEDPRGAASNEHVSEAARAEWLAAQKDERAIADLENEEDGGDTDSLMEWWYTVEKWDEVPSDEEAAAIQKDESKAFTILADKVHNGLRLFNKAFMERAEILWQSIVRLHGIADDISEFHQKAKVAGITGGTTTAVGSVAAITGLALAPFTFGASLVITAVGVGVAAAGGITSASAAISDNVHNNNDRKKVEQVLKEYEDHLLDIAKILHFINKGLYKLRGHPFLRSGTQHYSEDWGIRRAVQMISLVDSPVMRATELADTAVSSLQGLFKGMDKYFLKDRELKKGCRKEIVAEIRAVANVLNESIVEINSIRESVQEATGNI